LSIPKIIHQKSCRYEGAGEKTESIKSTIMLKISIISSSVRIERKSHRVALYFKRYLEENNIAKAEILDLGKYDFPLFGERLKFLKSPDPGAIDFAARINSSDGIIIVTPEYNGGYPASLKNAIDLLTGEWYHKPVAISTVSDGNFGGSQAVTSLQFLLWKLKALTVPAIFYVPNVVELFDENGHPTGYQNLEKRSSNFISELLWFIEAASGMSDYRKQQTK
jgi:NAD(P)H-dependent FMN reductase